MVKYSRSHGGMSLIRDEESIVLAAALTKIKLDYPPVDVFDVGIIGISSDPDTAADFGTKVETYPAGADELLDDTTIEYAQSFKSCHTMVNSVKLYMKAVGTFAGTLSVGIYTDDSGPNTIVGTAVTKTAAVLGTAKTLQTFTFTDVTGLTDNTTYWIVVGLDARTAGNVEVYGNANSASSYADGTAHIEPDGLGWDNYANADIYFRIDVTEIDVADGSISSYVQKMATDAEIVLGASSDDNLIYVVTYSTLYDEDLDDYLDTYNAMYLGEHVQNALQSDPRRFWFTLGMLVQKGNVELSHQLCRIDPSGGTTAGDTNQNLCTAIDMVCVKGA